MKKVKKMAEGGITGLSGLLGLPDFSPMPTPGLGGPLAGINPYGGGGGGGGSAMEGLGTVNQGASAIGSALSRASEAIGGGGGGGGRPPGFEMKKGGKVTTTRRVSTGEHSKKSPNW